MDQLIFASFSHTYVWYEVGMLKVPARLYTSCDRRKRERNLAEAKSVISKQTRGVKQQGVPALERFNTTKYTVESENAVPEVPPIKIKLPTTLSFEEPINSKYKRWLELKP